MAFARRVHGSSCACCAPTDEDTPQSEKKSYSPVRSSAGTSDPKEHYHPQLQSAVPFDIQHLIDANKTWSEDNREWFAENGDKKHSPDYLWIGCSDARVPANQMVGQDAGKIFVHRNIANQVVSSDMNSRSVLQYAVSVLKVPHIVVCGHYDCGGVRAAMGRAHFDSRDLGSPLEDWLMNIRDVSRLHKAELDAIHDEEAKHRRLVELNVIEQCLNIYKSGVVQRRRLVTSGVNGAYPQPRVHGVVCECIATTSTLPPARAHCSAFLTAPHFTLSLALSRSLSLSLSLSLSVCLSVCLSFSFSLSLSLPCSCARPLIVQTTQRMASSGIWRATSVATARSSEASTRCTRDDCEAVDASRKRTTLSLKGSHLEERRDEIWERMPQHGEVL